MKVTIDSTEDQKKAAIQSEEARIEDLTKQICSHFATLSYSEAQALRLDLTSAKARLQYLKSILL